MEPKKWYVMYCDDDDSHTLVPDEDVIYARDKTLLLPGAEAYFYDGGKKWRGVVKDFGTDYNILVKSRDKMNARKPRRNMTFNPDQPRRAKQKCNEALLGGHLPSSKSSASSSTKASTKTSQGELEGDQSLRDQPATSKDRQLSPEDQGSNPKEKQANNSQSKSGGKKKKEADEEMDEDPLNLSNSDSSDDSLTELEIKALAKLAKKKNRADLKELTSLAVKVSHKSGNTDMTLSDRNSPVKSKQSKRKAISSDSDSEVASHSKPLEKSVKVAEKTTSSDVASHSKPLEKTVKVDEETTAEKPKTADNVLSDEDSSDDNNNDKQESPKLTKKRSKPKSKFINPKPQFSGEYFIHKETDPNVVKLHEDYNVYVSEKVIKEVKRDTSITSTTALTRYIVKQVFTPEALQQCSVFGRPSACKGREAMACRPALHEDGVQAIIKFVLNRAIKKKLKGAVRSSVTSAMANIICEGRDLMKLEEEADKGA